MAQDSPKPTRPATPPPGPSGTAGRPTVEPKQVFKDFALI